MVKLYYSAGACSMSCVIAFEEIGLKYEPILVDWDHPDYRLTELNKLNPLGTAPVCVIDDNKVLTQNLAILEYFADIHPQTKLLPPVGTWERAQTMSWLSFAASDFHKSFGPLFALKSISNEETVRSEIRRWSIQQVKDNLVHLNINLQDKEYITGKNFTIADCYLFVVSNWTKWMNISIDSYSNLTSYLNRINQRQSVCRTLRNSGLVN